MSVLIVDDSVTIRSVLSGILEDIGIESEQAVTGEQALEYLSGDRPFPSQVLLDINLPGIDGYETATNIKQMAGDRHLPIIFLTGSRDENVLSKCLAVGDDYIAKPLDVDVITSKVKVHNRISRHHQKLEQQYSDLKRDHRHVDQEHNIVETIFANHFQKHISQFDNLRYHISPKSVFNGDVLLTAIGPSGNIYLAIGDVTGHGLPAAVGAIPAYSTFRTMANKGLSVGTIAAEMNANLRDLLPDNMMLAASLLELNVAEGTLTVWSGGMPPMVLADTEGNIKRLIEPMHCPLSMLAPHEFCQDVHVYKVGPSDRIYLFTDGVEESRNKNSEMFGTSRLHGLFDGSEGKMFDRIINKLGEFTGEQEQDDDITLVEVSCTTGATAAGAIDEDRDKDRIQLNPLPWSLTYELGIDEIKAVNPIPQILCLLSNATGLDVHQDYISTILSELYGNALEHGLLGLDSSLKSSEDGFIEYYRLRKQKLDDLQSGSIKIRLNYVNKSTGSLMEIRVEDSGAGFDYKSDRVSSSEDSFGRGVNIIREFCDKVEYSKGGSCVTVSYSV